MKPSIRMEGWPTERARAAGAIEPPRSTRADRARTTASSSGAGGATSVHVILSAEKYRQTAEVTITTRLHDFVGISESTNLETALREALGRRLDETEAAFLAKN